MTSSRYHRLIGGALRVITVAALFFAGFWLFSEIFPMITREQGQCYDQNGLKVNYDCLDPRPTFFVWVFSIILSAWAALGALYLILTLGGFVVDGFSKSNQCADAKRNRDVTYSAVTAVSAVVIVIALAIGT